MDNQLKASRKAIRDMGKFVTGKITASASNKLRNHSRVQHSGQVLESCAACRELKAAADKEALNG